jgi:hypothetical protein
MRLYNIAVYQMCQNYHIPHKIQLACLSLHIRPPQYYALPKVKNLNAQGANLLNQLYVGG